MKNNVPLVVVLALVILVLFAVSFMFIGGGPQDVQAAAPTPVADFLVPAGQPTTISFQTITVLTADTNTTGVEVMRLGAVDLQYIIDQTAVSSEMNTTTLTIQYSNDNSNWVDGLALASANAADGTSISRVPVFGRYMRVKQDVSNTNPITITLTAVGR